MTSNIYRFLATSSRIDCDCSRRLFLGGMALAVIPAWAKNPVSDRKVKIGWLVLRESIFKEPYSQAFVDRLNELGYSNGQNLVLVKRDAGENVDRLAGAAKELAASGVDVIFSGGGEAALLAVKNASSTIPAVFVAVDFDPIQAGHFPKISRPDGVLTGVSANQSLLPAKRLELLKILLPKAQRIAVFSNPQSAGQLAVAKQAAETLGVQLLVHELGTPPYNFESAFENAVRGRSDALMVLGSALFVSARQKLTHLATAHRLPTMFHNVLWTEAGGLASYGYNFSKIWRMGADMVAKVLSGVPIAELPVEFPTDFELAINLTTAKLLGIQIPYEIRLRADRFIT